jgi:hypothetical protein
MKVTSFLACQYANYTADGLVDLAGIGVDNLTTNRLPIGLSIKFFVRCESELQDVEGEHKVTLVFMGADKALSKHESKFVTTAERRNNHLIVDFLLRFDAEGDYRVDLSIDDRAQASWPLAVRLTTEMPPGAAGPQ